MKKKTHISAKHTAELFPTQKYTFLWHFCVAACRCFLTSASFTLSNKAEPAFYTHSLSCRVAHPALPSLCVCVCVWLTDSALVSIHIACWVRLFSLSAEPALPSAPLWPCLSHFCWLLYCAPVCVCARLCVCRCVSTHSFLFRPTVLGVLDCIWLNRNWISWQRQNEHVWISSSHRKTSPTLIFTFRYKQNRKLSDTSPNLPAHMFRRWTFVFLRSDGLNIFTL